MPGLNCVVFALTEEPEQETLFSSNTAADALNEVANFECSIAMAESEEQKLVQVSVELDDVAYLEEQEDVLTEAGVTGERLIHLVFVVSVF